MLFPILIRLLPIILLLIILLYLLMIKPSSKDHPVLGMMDGWHYAHRGLHDNASDAPENSLKAFQLAVEQGYGIEMDVQLTKDLVAVVFHDYNLRRSSQVDLQVSSLTYKELTEYCLFRSEEKIPTFAQVLECVDGKVPLIIELKIPWKAEQTGKAAAEILKNYHGVYCIESFNPLALLWYKKYNPNIVRGQLATDFNKEKTEGNKFQYFMLKHLLLNFLTKPNFIAYQHTHKKDLSFRLCKQIFGVKTAAWTIQSQQQLDQNKNDFNWFIFDSFIPRDKKALDGKIEQ